MSMRWLAVRLDTLTSLVTFSIAVVVVLTKDYIAPSYAAIALVYSARLTGLLQYTTRLASETEARFTSVERIHHYLLHAEEEVSPVIEDHRRPEHTWPQTGVISFDSYSIRYRPSLPLALCHVTCNIRAMEKVGIVGRTGSGKSTLVASLFRLIEPASGRIIIDDIDISTIGLDDLRSRLSIIPQDPVLFVGTIRYNLDPFEERTDEEIWSALNKCYMASLVSNLPKGIEAPVIENGENFSVGQRQLLCLARAVLRHSKILVMDEATAAIDTETDALIQTTMIEAFSDCTTLIVAHRLNTVLHCDRILVLDMGKVVEFDSPSALLQNPNSIFSSMLRNSTAKSPATDS